MQDESTMDIFVELWKQKKNLFTILDDLLFDFLSWYMHSFNNSNNNYEKEQEERKKK